MTAGHGIIHNEFHSANFAKSGGTMEMMQLWFVLLIMPHVNVRFFSCRECRFKIPSLIFTKYDLIAHIHSESQHYGRVNLPAAKKLTPAKYQEIKNLDIPVVSIGNDVATVRVIAGSFNGVQGMASTFTPINLWDVSLAANQSMDLATIEGHTTIIFCRNGSLRVNPEANTASIKSAQIAILSREGNTIRLESGTEGVQFMVLDGEPIKEPIAARGPFVMNTDAELRQAIADYQAGRMG
jgi:quercetin 2,3-dioxygenase